MDSLRYARCECSLFHFDNIVYRYEYQYISKLLNAGAERSSRQNALPIIDASRLHDTGNEEIDLDLANIEDAVIKSERV